jgi:hypothetical protein
LEYEDGHEFETSKFKTPIIEEDIPKFNYFNEFILSNPLDKYVFVIQHGWDINFKYHDGEPIYDTYYEK